MSVSKPMYDPKKCDGQPCPGDCDLCSLWQLWEDEEEPAMTDKQKKSTPGGAPVLDQDYGTTSEQKTQAEILFDRIGTGADRAVKRPKDAKVDRRLRQLIAEANMTDDCIINDGSGYFRPGFDDDIAAEEYFAKERHRAKKILAKVSRMEKEYDRRYQ